MRLGIALGLSVAAALGAAVRADAGEVVETYGDGTVRLRYQEDDLGRKYGRYREHYRDGRPSVDAWYRDGVLEGIRTEFHENGKVRARTVYRSGRREGRHEEWDAAGRPRVVAAYRGDRLDGKVERWVDAETRVVQVWKKGAIVSIDGVATHPRPREVVAATISRLLASSGSRPTEGEDDARPRSLADDRVAALARLQAYRYVCGVPHEDVVLDADANASAQAAAEICARLGDITHEPSNPGLEPNAYAFAFRGARGSNLHVECDACASIDGYMDDSDASNVDRLGHRRWCLNPRMVKTGFGVARDAEGKLFTAMWATDASRAVAPSYAPVTYPGRGYVPAALFGPEHAWSVSYDPARHPGFDPAAPVVRVYRLGVDYSRPAGPLRLAYLRVAAGDVGDGGCVIFRPAETDLSDGAAYWVEVAGMEGTAKKPAPLRYLVEFFGAREPAAEEPSEPDDDASGE